MDWIKVRRLATMSRLAWLLMAGVIVLALSNTVWAQNTATMSGTVKDAFDAAVPNADVSLTNSQQVVLKDAKTDAQGRFTFDGIPSGVYVIVVSRPDFNTHRRAVELTSGQNVSIDILLQVNQISEQVTVTSEAGLVAEARSVAQPVNVMNEEEILQRATEVVAQVVDEEPGVNLQRTAPSLSAVFVRGLTGRNVGVYVDGVRYTTSAQRGGVGTFFSLIEPSSLGTVEVLRGPSSSQYGSDVLGGVVNFLSHTPRYGANESEWHGNTNVFYSSVTNSFGGNQLLTYGTRNFGILFNVNARRVNRLRPGDGIDSHSALTRFLGISSSLLGSRLPDTGFTQYGSLLRTNFNLSDKTQLLFSYARNQQDAGKRYDQLLGGDGNLIADLRNLMTDFFYGRLVRQDLGFFDNASFTVSYNSQREERVNQGGQGNPVGAITFQPERTTVLGFNFFVDKQIGDRNTVLFGADVYRDHINAKGVTLDPVTRIFTPSRPRIPDGARYLSYGVFAQDVFTAIPERLRLSGAIRYNVASYRSRAANAAVVGGRPLFPDDSARFSAFSGRIGAVVTLGGGFDLALKYARGFRAPNTTDLGILGLVGTGFEVDAGTAASLGGFIGTTAGGDAVSTGIPVTGLGPETTDSFDFGLRYSHKRGAFEVTAFTSKLKNVYFDQALVLPPGAVGTFLGSEQIVAQNANGLVFVAAATGPVVVRVNFDDARFTGVEVNGQALLSRRFSLNGNFTAIHSKSLVNNLPPNVEGGTPAPTGFLSLRYQRNNGFYVEGYSTIAGTQDRLSSLDIPDRRTGAARSRAQIQNFFRRGACVRGITTPGATGCGSAGGILISTGETQAQVQNRVLPIGATINGVTVVNNDTLVPLFTEVKSYALFGLRGAYRFGDHSEIFVDFENIFDKSYRGISWGIDGGGRGVTVRYRYKF
ncbi:MAG TPA: TonB-dependent receptor [Pyrinomonadaceae bacterium]|nr:TonB-dependent receptor [Pyrinomonadaceae bacterium]